MALITGDANGPKADELFSIGLKDILYGYELNDSLTGNFGEALIYGGAGDDIIKGYEGKNTLYGGDGDDEIISFINDNSAIINNNESLYGGNGHDYIKIFHDYGTTMIDGGRGDDTLLGFFGNNGIYYGGSGNDDIMSLGGSVTVYGGTGDDIFYGESFDGNSNVTRNPNLYGKIYGEDGNDVLLDSSHIGNSGLYGGAGNDSLAIHNHDVDAGFSTLSGGQGNDTYIVRTKYNVFTLIENSNEGIDTVESTFSHTLANNIENLILQGNATRGYGNNVGNTITGNEQDNILDGKSGNDSLNGGKGKDIFYGGDGNDTLDNTYFGPDGLYHGYDSGTLYGGAGADQLQYGTLSYGGSGNDKLIGEVLYGDSGHDRLNGIKLYGGAGNDTLTNYDPEQLMDQHSKETPQIYGGAGNDTYITARDILITEKINEGIDTIQLSNTGLNRSPYILGANFENLVLMDRYDTNTYYGNGLNNEITGNQEDNIIDGKSGNDKIIGDSGNDVLNGGEGNDTLNGGRRGDTLYGGTGNDVIYGGADSDLIAGGNGIDILDGGFKDNTRDIFIFTSTRDSVPSYMDKIYNFAPGKDKINLVQIDANTALAGNQILSFKGTSAHKNAVWYDKTKDSIMVYADVTGDAKADFALRLVNDDRLIIGLKAGDFFL